MADQYPDSGLNSDRGNTIDSVDTDPSAKASVTGDDTAYPNHGIDGRSGNDAAKGGVLGAVGGAVVGAIAGGPVGAVIGAVAGGIASDAGVAAIDRVDNDNSPGENNFNQEARYLSGGTSRASDSFFSGNRDSDSVVNGNRDYTESTGTGQVSRDPAYSDAIDTSDAIADRSGYASGSANSSSDNTGEYDASGNRIR